MARAPAMVAGPEPVDHGSISVDGDFSGGGHKLLIMAASELSQNFCRIVRLSPLHRRDSVVGQVHSARHVRIGTECGARIGHVKWLVEEDDGSNPSGR
jgi:hypothetical protein